MVTTHGSLVPLASMHVAHQTGYQDEFARKLFRSFRDVFAAERLPERAVFWLDYKDGHVIVRHVRNLKRHRKSADLMVGKAPNDLDAVRILIGNFAAGCKLTTVKWELYGDFGLSNLLDMGRFDYADLTHSIDAEKASALTAQRIFPAGNWDFDGIMSMHQCLRCKKVFDKHSILYQPNKPCDSCGHIPLWNDAQLVIKDIMLGYLSRLERITTHPADLPEGEFAIQYFVDPIPNSVMYWLLSIRRGMTQPDPRQIFGTFENADFQKWLTTMYHRSLFHFMVADTTRRFFTEYMTEAHGKQDKLLKSWQRIGESLRTPLNVARVAQPDGFLASDLDLALALENFPALINVIILTHVTHEPQERKILSHDDID